MKSPRDGTAAFIGGNDFPKIKTHDQGIGSVVQVMTNDAADSMILRGSVEMH